MKYFYCLISFLLAIECFAADALDFDANLKAQVEQWAANKQIGFEENKGQMTDMEYKAAPYLLFKAESNGIDMYVTEWGLSYVFIKAEEEKDKGEKELNGPARHEEEKIKIEYCRADMELKGADIRKENIVKEYESQDFANYYLGHCPDGILNVRKYWKITIKNVYPNIDWVIYSTPLPEGKGQGGGVGGFKYDFIVHPGGNPSQIKLKYKWTDSPQEQSDGSLSIRTPMGTITEGAPYSYIQETNTQIQTSYTINTETDEVSFRTDNYNPDQTLIIDPQLAWGTYYGGSSHDGFSSVATDGSGNVFVIGYTRSTNFPILNPLGGAYFQMTNAGQWNAILLKFYSSGVRIWATYYGGNGSDPGFSLALDGSGNVFATGWTESTNFPTFDPGGGAYFQGTNGGANDIFLLKFSGSGVRLWASYYGGTGSDIGTSIATDGASNLFVTGYTTSGNFPALNPGSGAYFQGTYAGGGTWGGDAFILKFGNMGQRLWATYYGGSGSDYGYSIATDGSGNVFVTGAADSTDFPTFNPGGGAYFQGTYAGGGYWLWVGWWVWIWGGDAFILKFDNTGQRLWATYYGGDGSDYGYSLATDGSGNVFVTGATDSTGFPTFDPGGGTYFQAANAGGVDVFLLKFSNTGVLLWATYYGGNDADSFMQDRDREITIDDSGNVFVTGLTSSVNFPALNPLGGAYFQGANAGGMDVFLLKFNNNGVRLWSTYNGTVGGDFGCALAIDVYGCLFAVGEWTESASNGLMNLGGGAYYDATWNGSDDSYIMKFCPALSILSVTSTNILCYGACTGTGTVTPMGGSFPYSYSWNSVSPQTTQTATGLCAGIYTITVTDATGGTATAAITITQPPLLTATVTATADTCGSNNGSATVNAGGGTPGYSYIWNPPVNGQTTATVTGLSAGTYTSAVIDANGCLQTQTVTVITVAGPTATATAVPVSITLGANTTLTATGGGTYQWTPSTGLSCASCQNSIASPLVTTVYCVTVADANGCTDTACVTITVELLDCPTAGELYLPNAFSPNGDGENDMLKIYYSNVQCIKTLKLIIYNRWGEKVFETKNPVAEWDGSYRSKIENTAVFVYYLEATLISGEEISRKGNVCILR